MSKQGDGMPPVDRNDAPTEAVHSRPADGASEDDSSPIDADVVWNRADSPVEIDVSRPEPIEAAGSLRCVKQKSRNGQERQR